MGRAIVQLARAGHPIGRGVRLRARSNRLEKPALAGRCILADAEASPPGDEKPGFSVDSTPLCATMSV